MRYPLIAARLFNTTLMVRPETAFVFADAFVQIMGGGNVQQVAQSVAPAPEREAYTSRYSSARFKSKPYPMTEKGVAMLPVYGPLVQRMGEITPDCTELTSYEWMSRKLDMMQADPEVRGIVLELDSPGGHVAGNLEVARRIMAQRGSKPIYAHANEAAYSAAYSLGSSASRLYTSDTGGVGSIGVMLLHMSYAERDAKLGYKYTALYRGARKNDFNPHEPLSDEARAVADAMLDRDYDIFTQHVSQARHISVESVKATEAGLLDPDTALAGKFIDGIQTFEETLRTLEEDISRSTSYFSGPRMAADGSTQDVSQRKEHQMTDKTAAKEYTQADLDKARAEGMSAGEEKAKTEAKARTEPPAGGPAAAADPAVARKAERDRIVAITNSEEAKKRPVAAQNVAMNTDMALDDARKFLAGLPEEAKGGSQFGKVMEGLGNPKVSGGDGGDAPVPGAALNTADIYARRAKDHEKARLH